MDSGEDQRGAQPEGHDFVAEGVRGAFDEAVETESRATSQRLGDGVIETQGSHALSVDGDRLAYLGVGGGAADGVAAGSLRLEETPLGSVADPGHAGSLCGLPPTPKSVLSLMVVSVRTAWVEFEILFYPGVVLAVAPCSYHW